MGKHLKLLSSEFLPLYSKKVQIDWLNTYISLNLKKNFTQKDFLFYIQSSATFSSNIEGNSIDFDSYLKNKAFKIKSKPKEMAEIDDLVDAYNFAIQNKLNQKNLFNAHKILSSTILSLKSHKGKLRSNQVGIYSNGKLVYMGADYKDLKTEFSN